MKNVGSLTLVVFLNLMMPVLFLYIIRYLCVIPYGLYVSYLLSYWEILGFVGFDQVECLTGCL